MRRRPAILGFALLILCGAPSVRFATAQENTIRLEVEGRPATVIGAFRRQGILYASVNDIVQVLSLPTYENPRTAKLVVRQRQYRVTVTGGSPFVVLTDLQNRRTVYQLPASVVHAAGAYFIPLQSFGPYVEFLTDAPAQFDAAAGILRIGAAPVARGTDIPMLRLEPKANGMLVRIQSAKRLVDLESWLRPDGWLYVTIADARADTAAINRLPRIDPVKEIVAIQSPTSVQLTFRIDGKVEATELVREEASDDILLVIRTREIPPPKVEQAGGPPVPPAAARSDTAGPPAQQQVRPTDQKPPAAAAPAAATGAAAAGAQGAGQAGTDRPETARPETRQPDLRGDLQSKRRRWELDVIVIDPGHGGYDPGSIGVTGLKEKTVTLGIGLKLGKLLTKNLPGVQVVYTRKTDTFVELDRRGRIANEAGGKLFVSIHANSMPRKPNPASGFEVYLLRPGRTDEAIEIAERENAVIKLEQGYEERYKHLTDENFILVAMAQSAYVKASEVFADLTREEMERRTGLENRGVKQAGFYVLVGASMPNILVETAYLSNRSDEKFLKSEAGQQKIAEALYRAVKRYKAEHEKLLMEGADLGAR